MHTVSRALALGVTELAAHTCAGNNAHKEAEWLLSYVLGHHMEWISMHSKTALTPTYEKHFFKLIAKRIAHHPVAYLTGSSRFFDRDFFVTQDTLIPRPATEELVEAVLARLAKNPVATIIDVGTGSGCLAVTLALEQPRARILATDISQPALLVAKKNADNYRVRDRIQFLHTDALPTLSELSESTIIVANLPYIPTNDIATLSPDIKNFEPHTALDGGHDGLDLYKKLLCDIKNAAPKFPLALFFEILPEQFAQLSLFLKKLSTQATIAPIKNIGNVIIGAQLTLDFSAKHC